MIRVLGHSALLLAVAIISYRVGVEVTLYHASVGELVEAARLRAGYYAGINP